MVIFFSLHLPIDDHHFNYILKKNSFKVFSVYMISGLWPDLAKNLVQTMANFFNIFL
jgi:hypothetical protein